MISRLASAGVISTYLAGRYKAFPTNRTHNEEQKILLLRIFIRWSWLCLCSPTIRGVIFCPFFPIVFGNIGKKIFLMFVHIVFCSKYSINIIWSVLQENMMTKSFFFTFFLIFTKKKMLPEGAPIHYLQWFGVLHNTCIHIYGCFINWYPLSNDFATLWCSKFIILVVPCVILGPPGHQNG